MRSGKARRRKFFSGPQTERTSLVHSAAGIRGVTFADGLLDAKFVERERLAETA